jgi:aldehyde:ferredoxin oxidoreductase
MVRGEVDDSDIDLMAIGQAGESLIKFACVNATMGHTASYGMGAVMGSKNLKAVTVRGSNDINIAAPEEFSKSWEELTDYLMNNKMGREQSFRLGTTWLLSQVNAVGGLGTKNFQTQVFEGADKISGETLCETYLLKRRGCFICPLCCDRFSVVTDGPYKGAWVSGPEYATLHAFGSRLGNDNLASIIKANQLCDEFGLDIYSTGGVIGFAMELYEKGIITREDTDGLVLEWGNHESMIEMIKRIVYRQGLGDILAEGVREAAERIGKGSEYYALEVKGKEYASQDPRVINRYGLGCMVCSRGADPNVAWVDPSAFAPEMARKLFGTEFQKAEASRFGGKPGVVGLGKVTAWGQELGVVLDLLGVCKLTYFAPYFALPSQILTKMFSAATGFKMDEESMFEVAKRIITLERAYNIREKGLTRKEDQLPERFLKEPVSEGPAKGMMIEQDRLLDEYYEFEGWDKTTGWPTKDVYKKLGLEHITNELTRLKRLP